MRNGKTNNTERKQNMYEQAQHQVWLRKRPKRKKPPPNNKQQEPQTAATSRRETQHQNTTKKHFKLAKLKYTMRKTCIKKEHDQEIIYISPNPPQNK